MPKTVKEMMDAANAAVPRVTPTEAKVMITRGGVIVIDVRDAAEVEKTGKIAGAVHVSRSLIEFRADPASPVYDKRLDRSKQVIVYCASGGRSALAGKTLKDMGFDHVYNLGGFKDWADSGGSTE